MNNIHVYENMFVPDERGGGGLVPLKGGGPPPFNGNPPTSRLNLYLKIKN